MESAFADPGAVPETLDLAGPSARVTVYPAGLGEGQGRLSYFFLSDGQEAGLWGAASIEQAQPQIVTAPNTGTYSHYPDFITTLQYTQGEGRGVDYIEDWHVQFGSVFRSLGLEDDADTFDQNIFGWGLSLSGTYRFYLNPDLTVRDGVFCSVTYGQGISHYIADLNAAGDTNDAVINLAGDLVTLPVLAWYAGYTHNWTDNWRSTATYSVLSLDSIVASGATFSSYRRGDYAAINLVYHDEFPVAGYEDGSNTRNFYTGIEYLYGHKQTLDGETGDAHRLMWVTAISK
jgi:hypothetical protein